MKRIPESLPEHAFPLQNYGLEKTRSFHISCHRKKDGLVILAGMRDPGEAAALLPPLTLLSQASDVNDIFVVTDSKAQEALSSSGINIKNPLSLDPLLMISRLSTKADVAFTGFAAMPGTEFALTENAKYDKIPVIWLQDYPGGFGSYYRHKLCTNPTTQPDYLFVVNQHGKEQELKYMPNFNPDNVLITGQPADDKFAREDQKAIKAEVKTSLGISSDIPLITFMGVPRAASAQALALLIEGINRIGLTKFKLAVRRHPRDMTPLTEYDRITQSISSNVVDTAAYKTDQVGIASDLVVTINSLTGIDAVRRGIPSIHILTKEILAVSEAGIHCPTPKEVTDGASIGIFSPEEITSALQNIFFNPEYRQQLARNMSLFTPQDGATERVANLVLQIAKEHRKDRR